MRSVVMGLVLGAGLILAPVARADGEDPRRVQAEALMKQGTKLHEAYEEEQALAKFREAYALYPTPNALFAMATAEQFLNKHLDAIRHYREALRNRTLHPNNAERGREYIKQLEAKLGRVQVNAPKQASIKVDGTPYEGPPGEPIDVEPGDHVIEASMDDQRKSAPVHCDAGQLVTTTLAFDVAPPQTDPSPPREEGGGSVFSTRNVVAGSVGLVGLGVAAVGLGFLVDSNSKDSDADALNARVPGGACAQGGSPECASFRSQLDDASSSRTLSTVSFIAGGALIATAVVLFAVLPSRKDGKAGMAATTIARNAGGFRVDF